MKEQTLLVMVLGAGLGLASALPAAAERSGPCAADAARFCKDVKPGEGRVAACLKEHEKDLSQACRDRKALAKERRGENKGWEKGRGASGTCMREYGQGFASGFKRGFKMRGKTGRAEGRGKRNKEAGKVCAEDAQKLCAGIKPGEGRVRDCLLKNAGKLSDGCKQKVEKAKARQEEQGKKV
ncbi:MAG: cysteine rich repeat-containing protein [Elusimicrobiales bacterium]|nr:cysteine rich repeat-containing protein [Elusimicrobiales bacterium]